MRQHCGPGIGWMRCSMIFCATRCATWQPRLSYSHESDDDDIEERYLAKYVNLPRKMTVDVSLCHACHVKRRWISPSTTAATQRAAASQATNPDQARHPVPKVPRLPRKMTVDVSVCHACHAKRRWMWVCATPATWNERGCHQVPRLPHTGHTVRFT